MQTGQGMAGNGRAAVALGLVILVLIQQVSAGPVPYSDQAQTSSEQSSLSLKEQPMRVLRRTARMTPLWRIVGTKPLGAHCHNNYECSTGICGGRHCSRISKPVKY